MAQKRAKGAKSPQNRTQDLPQASSSSGVTGKDILHVVLIGLVCTILFTGIGIAIAMSQGMSFSATTSNLPTEVVINGTPVPTIPPTAIPTEIPCEAQAWWDSISPATATVVNNLMSISVALPPQQITGGRDAASTWNTTLDGQTAVSPCVQPAYQTLQTAADETAAMYGLYLTTSDVQARAQQFLRAMDAFLGVTDALENLKVTVSEDWFQKVRDFTRSDCPVRRWYIEQFVIRDYNRYFAVLEDINIQTMSAADLQNKLIDLRTLSTSFKADMPNYPACVQTASGHYAASMDATIRALNEALNGNMGAINGYLVTTTSEKTAFQTELTKLDSTLLDPNSLNL